MYRKKSASWHGMGNRGVANIRITRPARKPTYGAYPIVSRVATAFSPRLHRPSFRLFVLLVTGWTLSCRHRYITECIFTAGQVGLGHWSCYHRFFSHFAWPLDGLCHALAQLLLERFAPDGPILLAADDTLCRKRGLGLFGAGMHHDPLFSSKALQVFSWGHNWVVLALLVRLSRWAPTKVFALPLAFRLYVNGQGLAKGTKKSKLTKKQRPQGHGTTPTKKKKWRPADPNHRTRPELLVELLQLVAGWFPQRQFVVCADNGYAGKSVLRQLPANVDLISHVHPQGVLYAPPPPPTGNAEPGARRGSGCRDSRSGPTRGPAPGRNWSSTSTACTRPCR
jgi:hypothetical protein